MILVDIIGAESIIRSQEALTVGMVGSVVEFHFDEAWNKLTKTVVFRANGVTKDVVGIDSVAVIPPDVLQVPGVPLHIGVYGKNAEDKIVIPTIWAKTERIRAGADPDGDESTNPALPVWAQLEERVVAAERTCADVQQTVADLNTRMDTQQETIEQSAQTIIDDGVKDVQTIKNAISQELVDTKTSVKQMTEDAVTDIEDIKDDISHEMATIVLNIQTTVDTGIGDMQAIKTAAAQEVEAAQKEIDNAVAQGLKAMQETAKGNEAYTKEESDSRFAPPIICTASGQVISVADAASRPLQGLTLYGKTLQNGTPTPESPVALESLGAGGAIDTTVCSSNLCNPNGFDLPDYYTVGEDGYITFSNTRTDINYHHLYLSVPKGTYTVVVESPTDIEVYVRYKENQGAGIQVRASKTLTIDVDDVTEPVRIMAVVSPDQSRNIRFTVNAGDIAFPYEPYKEPQTITASTPNGLPGIPVESGGNYTDENGQAWICDEVDFARGVYARRIGRKLFNGSESWDSNNSNFIHYNDEAPIRINPPMMSSAGRVTHSVQDAGGYGFCYAYGFRIRFENMNPERNTVAELKAYLAENPIEAIMALKTPIETALSAQELAAFAALQSHKPHTTAFNDAGAGMKLSYVADTKTYIDQKLAAISAALLNT